MKGLPETPEGFTEVIVSAGGAPTPVGVEPTKVDGPRKGPAQVTGTCHPATGLVGNVVLHAGSGIYIELPRVDGPSQSLVVLPRVLPIRVPQRVVDVLFGSVDAQPLCRYLELASGVSKAEEGQDPYEDADRLGWDPLERADIDGLAIVPTPISKIASDKLAPENKKKRKEIRLL